MRGFSIQLSDSILIARLNGAYLRTNSNKNNGLCKTKEKKKSQNIRGLAAVSLYSNVLQAIVTCCPTIRKTLTVLRILLQPTH